MYIYTYPLRDAGCAASCKGNAKADTYAQLNCEATVTATSYTSPGTQTWCRGDNWNHTGFYTVTPAECEAKCTADAECM